MTKKKATDYTPDPANANAGTERGVYMVEESLQQYGAGRSILVDKNNVVIAGNKTLQGAIDSGIVEVVEVETQGDRLVVVKRTDLDLSNGDERARKLAYIDNRASDVGLAWNPEQLLADIEAGIDLSGMFRDWEIEQLIANVEEMQDFDPNAEWEGMPEYEQEDRLADSSIIVNFASAEDRQAFAEFIRQPLTEKTKSVWYPVRKRVYSGQVFKSES